jgi:DNA-binding beta-propeller fold protein YncE
MNKLKTLMTGILLVLASFAINANAGFITDVNRVDVAYDTTHQVLYISGGETVRRYDMVNKKFLAPITLGGETLGMDISADGKLLAVANSSTGTDYSIIDIINLRDLSSKRVRFDLVPGDGGTFAVAFDALGGILVSNQARGSTGGWTSLKKYNYFTKKTTAFGLTAYNSMLTPSIDRKIIAVAAPTNDPSNMGVYKAGDESFVADKSSTYHNVEVGVSYNGKQITALTLGGAVVIDAKKTFPIIGDPAGILPMGVAYSPAGNHVYFAMANSDYIAAYNTKTMTELAQYKVPGHFDETGISFSEGRTKIASDNSFLFSTLDNGIYYLPLRKPAQ